MSGLPKKYAKMGFKKGWIAYKHHKPARRTSRRKTQRVVRRHMAKKTYTRRARSYGTSLLSSSSINDAISGVMGGAVAGLINKFVGDKIPFGLGTPISYIGAGMLMKNKTLETIGGVTLGQNLVGGLTGGNGTTNSSIFEG